MTVYSYAQLEGLWIDQGGPRALAPLMAAIAMAESGGDSDARNPSGATGLWQILGAVYPRDAQALTDPAVNAREAIAKYKTQGLKAWVTYTSGAYKQFLRGSVPPNTNVPGSGGLHIPNPLGVPGGVIGAFTSAGTAIDWLLQPSHWVRIICGALGSVSLLGGLWLMSHAGGG